ncbi:MAG: hypothetical protein Q9170_005322 [Blastenia crenularia]
MSTLSSFVSYALSSSITFWLLAILFALYLVSLAVFRLYLSPLASVPGPKLAALTLWYEFYHDLLRKGQYIWVIGKMHAKYGPIVRISPNEVHIADKDFYDTLFGSTLKLDKDPWLSNEHPSTMGTSPHELHRIRRAVLNPFFSTQKVVEIQDLIKEKIGKLCEILERHRESGEPINMSRAYRAMTMDIITEYVMTSSFDFLDSEDFGGRWYTMIRNGSASQILMTQNPWIMPIMTSLPYKLAIALVPDAEAALGIQKMNERQIQTIKDAGPGAAYEKKVRKPLFHEIYFNSELPEPEKATARLGAEATLIVIAGSETSGGALTHLHYQLLTHPETLARLKRELHENVPGNLSDLKWQDLRKLPYLTACIQETLRLAHTTIHRLARFAPVGGLQYEDYYLPAGTTLSMSTYFAHMDPSLFPDPDEFIPERWLSPDAKALSRYMNPFSKGPRICLGIELAYAELYLTAAMVYRTFGTKLFETTKEDVEVKHDFFNGYPSFNSRGVRVTVV